MELPQETQDYIRESIDHSVGLPVSTDTLLHKLRAVETSHLHLRHQCVALHSKLKEKDDIIERSRAEANMNAVALKKFVDENQKFAVECSHLLASCNKWERECALYDNDREALMDFANEADEKAKEAESRNRELEEENKRLLKELRFHESQSGQLVNLSMDDMQEEQILLDSLLTTLFGEDETASTCDSFLEANNGLEICQKLLSLKSLRPLTQKVVALAAEVKTLERDKDHLMTNLRRAEEEVNVLFDENNILNEENKRLMRLCYREKHMGGSGGDSASGKKVNTDSASGKKGKRKCSSQKISSPVEKKLDFGGDVNNTINTHRQPLSPLQSNSPVHS